MRQLIKTIVLLLGMPIYAQITSSMVISTSGDSQISSMNKVYWTLGEPIIGLMGNQDLQLSNGYHQHLDLQSLSITDNDIMASILVYPNPATEHFMVSNKLNEKSLLHVYDEAGRSVLEQEISQTETKIDLKNFPPGIYMLHFTSLFSLKSNSYKLIKK